MKIRFLLRATAIAAAFAGSIQVAIADEPVLKNINHFVVIYLENRSFDHLFGDFPFAAGRSDAGRTALIQRDQQGRPYDELPDVKLVDYPQPTRIDDRFPHGLPNQPFDIGSYVPRSKATGDLDHIFYNSQRQMNNGRMDSFVAWCGSGALTFGYYDMRGTHLWRLAREFTLADNFFQAAFGGSYLNHQWLIAAATPYYPDAPQNLRTTVDAEGNVIKEGTTTPDGYAVNTIEPAQEPSDPQYPVRLPLQHHATIGERLNDRGISWAWYAGGWNNAVAGKPDPSYQYHHQPFVYFAGYGAGEPGRAGHLKDYEDMKEAIRQGNLPAVSFYKPLGDVDQHSGYSNIGAADTHVGELVEALRASPQWKDMAIIITYDEFGGYWDHVAPPKIDRWGSGPRIPAVIVSPHAKKGYVDHVLYDTTSILATLEHRFGLQPLTERDAKANDLRNAFAD